MLRHLIYPFLVYRVSGARGHVVAAAAVSAASLIVAGFFSLGTVIDARLVTRIVAQLMGQVFGLIRLRRRAPDMARPYRMWLYPVPALVELAGYIFVFATTQVTVTLFGVGVQALGGAAFLVWARRTGGGRSWWWAVDCSAGRRWHERRRCSTAPQRER